MDATHTETHTVKVSDDFLATLDPETESFSSADGYLRPEQD